MSNLGNAFFHRDGQQYPASVTPVWLEVKERKIAGGTVDIKGLPKGTLIPLGIPTALKVMGGVARFLETFSVQEAVTASSTSLKIKPENGAVIPAKGLILGKIDSAGNAAKAVALAGDPTVANGVYTFTIEANALGVLAVGDLLCIISEAGENKKALVPDGLSWRQIFIDSDNAYAGTVAVVTKGQILADRIAALPDFYKASMPGITLEYEAE